MRCNRSLFELTGTGNTVASGDGGPATSAGFAGYMHFAINTVGASIVGCFCIGDLTVFCADLMLIVFFNSLFAGDMFVGGDTSYVRMIKSGSTTVSTVINTG